ncbi:MAG: hypothetical protein ABH823_04375 [bacterium]
MKFNLIKGEKFLGETVEIFKIEEANQALLEKQADINQLRGRTCIYCSEVKCQAPKLAMKICRSCPRAAQFIRKNVVQNIFDKINGLAIMLMNMGGGGAGGAGGGSGGGAGGAGGGAGGGG